MLVFVERKHNSMHIPVVLMLLSDLSYSCDKWRCEQSCSPTSSPALIWGSYLNCPVKITTVIAGGLLVKKSGQCLC